MQTRAKPTESPRPFWLTTPLVAFVVFAQAALRGIVAFETDLLPDEAYYAMWSLRLAPGYFDHPPAIAWLIAFGRWLVAESSLGVRFVSLLAPIIVSLTLYRTGALLTDRTTALLAVLWYNLSIGVALSLLATPDAPSTLFWMLAVWAVAEFITSRNANWWLLVGVFAGLGVLSKYTNLFFGAGLVLFLLAAAERRRWVGLWQLWAGGLCAALIAAPNLLWNAQNGWITLAFQFGRIATPPPVADVGANYLDLLGGQALFLGPVIVVCFIVAIALFALRPWRWPALAWPILGTLPPLIYFVVHAARSHVEANWPLPLWPMATLAATHVLLAGLTGRQLLRVVSKVAIYAQTLFGVIIAVLLNWVAFTHPAGLQHLDRTRDMRGWSDLARQLDAIADARGASWIITPEGYGTVGLLASYSRFVGAERPVISTDESFRYRFDLVDPAALPFPTILVTLTRSREQLATYFGAVMPIVTIERKFGDEVIAHYQVFAVDQPTPAFFEAVR